MSGDDRRNEASETCSAEVEGAEKLLGWPVVSPRLLRLGVCIGLQGLGL